MKSLRLMLTMLVAAGIAAASLLTASAFWTDHRSSIAVDRALVAKDVTADILPPPLYLIELRLVLSEAIEGALLVGQRALRRVGGIFLERPMHALVAAVLLRRPGGDPFGADAELDPPDREPRQARGRDGGERRPVVGANGGRQPELGER